MKNSPLRECEHKARARAEVKRLGPILTAAILNEKLSFHALKRRAGSPHERRRAVARWQALMASASRLDDRIHS
jgi:hypothetical protein